MKNFAQSKLSVAIIRGLALGSIATGLAVSPSLMAQEGSQERAKGFETIEVTATRRSGSIQEVPLNVTALNGDVMKEQNILELADVARWVPGLTVQDQGGRSSSPIIVRGLNTNSSGPGSDGGTVATYVGEIPLFVDLKLIDVERVEVLIGPQGTLYGAGTLGGAIRYLPKKPELDITTFEVSGDLYSLSEADSLGNNASFVFNTPLINDTLGLRVAINRYDDPGYIDYNYLVQNPGVSLPDPWAYGENYSSHLTSKEDANTEETLTTKIALRWVPTDWLDATLSYFVQDQDVGARSITHYNSLAASNPLASSIGPYDSAYRYLEPREKKDELLSLELTADLGFAELTSASGWSSFEAVGQRDQTDLLIRLDYGYEAFPAFSSFTREEDNVDNFTQEIRLVSTYESAFSWIVGGYYNKNENDGLSSEFTPGFDQFAVDNYGGVQLRPDALEYISYSDAEVTEKALFGELAYQITDEWQVTVGSRFFEYEVTSTSGIDLPLFETVFLGRTPADLVDIALDTNSAEDDGNLFKFNTSYQFNDQIMGYFTLSDGYRIGGANGVAACPSNINEIPNQIVCALPKEQVYTADTTTNIELGFKSTLLDRNLILNGAIFSVEWEDAQITGATENGQQPIITNAGTAEAKGIELSARMILSDNMTGYATYSHTKAELTEDAPNLFGIGIHAFAGDRLPGSSENQLSFGLNYSMEVLGDKFLDLAYGMTYQSDMITKVGLRDNGETQSGYGLHNISAKLSDETWDVTFYVNNLFDKYAWTSTRRDVGDITTANRTDIQRNYGHYVLQPRKVGVRFTYKFEDF